MTRNQQARCLVSLFFGHEAAVLQTLKFDITIFDLCQLQPIQRIQSFLFRQ